MAWHNLTDDLDLEARAALDRVETGANEIQHALRRLVGDAVAANMRPDAIHGLGGLYESAALLFSTLHEHVAYMRDPDSYGQYEDEEEDDDAPD
jgi:hypothetical protein